MKLNGGFGKGCTCAFGVNPLHGFQANQRHANHELQSGEESQCNGPFRVLSSSLSYGASITDLPQKVQSAVPSTACRPLL